MNEVDVTPAVSDMLSSEVIELDNPVLEKAAAGSSGLVEPSAVDPNAVDQRPDQAVETDDWETLALPGAVVDVDELPEGESIDIVTSLEQQNHTLRERVVYLETSLENTQANLCQEVARWEALALAGDERLAEQAQAQEQAIARYVEELTSTQKRLTEVFAKLELAHQSAQRQQIVMETLNTQLQNSQERVAQLERECAGLHQRNVDQAQHVLQQEHQVRDLQARLQRQQRYTLQYKAALEKSLDVSHVDAAAAPALLSETTARQLAAKYSGMPKPSPVKPWSAGDGDAGEGEEALSQKAWLNSFLSESGMFPMDDVLANFDWQPIDEEPSDTPVSFDLEESAEPAAICLNPDQLSIDRGNPENPVGVATASPFITLQETADGDGDGDADDEAIDGTPMPKRESLAAVDLPMFSPTEAAMSAAVDALDTVDPAADTVDSSGQVEATGNIPKTE